MTSTSAQQTFRWIPGDYNLIGDTRWKDQNRRTLPFRFENPKNPIPCNSGTVELYACCPSAGPAGPAVRDGASPARIIIIIILVIFLVSFFISFLLLASVFSLMRINQTFLLCKTLANGDNAFVQHAPRPQSLIISVLLGYSACQTASESIISLANKIPPPLSTAADSRGPWRRLEKNQLDWHRLIAHSGLKIGKTRQTVNQIHSISAGIKSGCFT